MDDAYPLITRRDTDGGWQIVCDKGPKLGAAIVRVHAKCEDEKTAGENRRRLNETLRSFGYRLKQE